MTLVFLQETKEKEFLLEKLNEAGLAGSALKEKQSSKKSEPTESAPGSTASSGGTKYQSMGETEPLGDGS